MAFKPNVNFGASNVVDPTAGARQALQSVGGLLDDYSKRQQSTQEMLLREQGRQDTLAQQALANTRADEQLRMQQASAQQSTDAINRGLAKEEATKNLFTNVPKNTLDPYMDSLSAQYTEGKLAEQQANLAAGRPLLTKYKGATDAENVLGMQQGAATQEQRNQVATLKDKVIDPADYQRRVFDEAIASGLGIDAATKAADQVYKQNAIETPKANTDLIKMQTNMAEDSYKAETDRLKTLLNVGVKGDKTSKSGDGYTGNDMKDQVKLIEKVQLMAPNTDWNIFGKDYGGEDIAPMIVDKMKDNKLTAPQMEVALLLAKEGANDALFNKDVEFSGSKLDKAIELIKANPEKYAYSEKTSAGINTALYNSSMDALNKARDKTNAELQQRMASATATAVQPTQAAYEKQIRESIFGAPKASTPTGSAVDSAKDVKLQGVVNDVKNELVTKYGKDTPEGKGIVNILSREGLLDTVKTDGKGISGGFSHRLSPQELLLYPEGTEVPYDVARKWLDQDTNKAFTSAKSQANELEVAPDSPLAVALAGVNFQLGSEWNKDHTKTWELLKNKEYDKAIEEVRSSDWDKQTKVRVDDFVNAMKEQKGVKTGDSLVSDLFTKVDTTKGANTNKSTQQTSGIKLQNYPDTFEGKVQFYTDKAAADKVVADKKAQNSIIGTISRAYNSSFNKPNSIPDTTAGDDNFSAFLKDINVSENKKVNQLPLSDADAARAVNAKAIADAQRKARYADKAGQMFGNIPDATYAPFKTNNLDTATAGKADVLNNMISSDTPVTKVAEYMQVNMFPYMSIEDLTREITNRRKSMK